MQNNTLFILAEQIGNLFPGHRKPDYYIQPLLRWMSDEWKVTKKLIAKNLLDIASGKVSQAKDFLLEQEEILSVITFSDTQRGLVKDLLGLLIGRIADGTKDRTKKIKKQAKIDAGGWFQARTAPTTILLSREGLDEVIKSLTFQEDFVDDVTQNTQARIDRLLKARYGSLMDFSKQVDHTLRISRDDLLDAFHLDVDDIANRVRNGIITPDKFHDGMLDAIGKNYRKIYRQAKGSPLTVDEENWLKAQVESQRPYLDNFRDLLNRKQVMGDELTSYVNWRAGLYSERGDFIYEFVVAEAYPDDILWNWVRTAAESCETCIINERNNPHVKADFQIIGYPGGQGGNTACGTNCRCFLAMSELYASK